MVVGRPNRSNKISVSISINADVDRLFERLCSRVVEVDGEKIVFSTTKNEVYNKALEYAIKNINEWF